MGHKDDEPVISVRNEERKDPDSDRASRDAGSSDHGLDQPNPGKDGSGIPSSPSQSNTALSSPLSSPPLPTNSSISQDSTPTPSSSTLATAAVPTTTPSSPLQDNDPSNQTSILPITLTITRTVPLTDSTGWPTSSLITSWVMTTTVAAPITLQVKESTPNVGLMLAPTLALLVLLLLCLLGFLIYRNHIKPRRSANLRTMDSPSAAFWNRSPDMLQTKFVDNANWNVPLMRDVEAYGPQAGQSPNPFSSSLDPAHNRYTDPYENGLPRLHRYPSNLSRALETDAESTYSRPLYTESVYSGPTEMSSGASTISSVSAPFYEKLKAARRAGELNKISDSGEEVVHDEPRRSLYEP